MMNDTANHYLIIGMGVTGLSVARYLDRAGIRFEIADGNAAYLDAVVAEHHWLAGVPVHAGEIADELLGKFERVIVSPGVPVRDGVFSRAREAGVEIISDVELFARTVEKPVLAVTGSNGKSTVVSMVGSILQEAGFNAAVVGNVGTPVLDRVDDTEVDFFILELSSFQLETTFSLRSEAAVVLNVSEDHMDRYDDIDDYAEVKRRVYRHTRQVVCNADDKRTWMSGADSSICFSMANQSCDWFLEQAAGNAVLTGSDGTCVPTREFVFSGLHNYANALAAIAVSSVLLKSAGLHRSGIYASGLGSFEGLPHRTQLVGEINGVRWFNDSKGTNVGACVSAIKGMSGPVVLIAGGQGKDAEFSPLAETAGIHCRSVILLGEDASRIQQALGDSVPVQRAVDLPDAVQRAAAVAVSGDSVLLSPACASFDMFRNFEERGNAFISEVQKLCA